MKFNALAVYAVTLPLFFPSAIAANTRGSNPYAGRTPVSNPYAAPSPAPSPAPDTSGGAAAATAAAGPNNNNHNNTKKSAEPQQQQKKKIAEFDGRAAKTKEGHAGSVKKWDKFAAINNYPSFWKLKQLQVCGKVYANGSIENPENPPLRQMMAEFAQYLFEYVKSGGEDDEEEAEILSGDAEDDEEEEDDEAEIETARAPYNGLAPKVILQHFTTMKSKFFSRFPPLAFRGHHPKWYKSLHDGVKCRVAADCLARGGKITKKAVGFGREVLIDICDHLLKQEGDEALGYEERCIVALLYAAVGRGGEVSYATWNSARWDKARQHLVFDWGEKKKGAQYVMTFHPDSTDWRVDVIHALACYVLCGQGSNQKASTSPQESGVHWIFGSYVGMAEGGAASKVSRILEKCRKGGVNGVPADSNSHGVRVGATDEMIFNHMLSIFAAIARGGWDFKTDNMIFYYFTQDLHVAQAGKALANWSNPNMNVSAPTLEVITDENDEVERFCKALFTSADIPGVNSELVDVRNAMVATLLRYYDDVCDELGHQALIIRTLHNAAIECKIDLGKLKSWGKQVKEDFIVKNAQNFGDSAGSDRERVAKAMALLQETCSNLLEQQRRQECHNKIMLQRMDEQEKKLDQQSKVIDYLSSGMNTLLHTLCSNTPSPTNPNKKRRTSTLPPTAAATGAIANEAITNADSATVNAFEELTAPKRQINWETIRDWNCAVFVQEVVRSNVDVDSDNFLPAAPSDDKTRKERLKKLRHVARQLLASMKEIAQGDEEAIFLQSNVPMNDDDARAEWLNHVKETANSVAMRLARSVIKRLLRAKGEYSDERFRKKFDMQKMNVGSIYNKVVEVNTAENKKK
jgi:hypothetical protein